MKRFAIPILAAIAARCSAADLTEECARWAPIADHGDPAVAGNGYASEGPSQFWAQAWAIEQPRLRLDGLRIVVREQAWTPDAQIAGGYHHDTVGGSYVEEGPWARAYARAGTDPLAAQRGAALGAVGLSVASVPWIGLDAELGASSERHVIVSGDFHLPALHVAGSHDDRVDTTRVGLEIRVPGSVNLLAWNLALDGASSRRNDLPSSATRRDASGFLGELTVTWSPWNHWLIAGQAALATNAMRDDGWQGTVGTGSIALGLGW